MSNKTVTIESVDHKISNEVFDLIHETSLERDECRSTLKELGYGEYSASRIVELVSKGLHFEEAIEHNP